MKEGLLSVEASPWSLGKEVDAVFDVVETIVVRKGKAFVVWLDMERGLRKLFGENIKVRRFRGKFVVVLSKDPHLSNCLINLGRDLMNNYAIRLFPWD